jgi:hypothetical protein
MWLPLDWSDQSSRIRWGCCPRGRLFAGSPETVRFHVRGLCPVGFGPARFPQHFHTSVASISPPSGLDACSGAVYESQRKTPGRRSPFGHARFPNETPECPRYRGQRPYLSSLRALLDTQVRAAAKVEQDSRNTVSTHLPKQPTATQRKPKSGLIRWIPSSPTRGRNARAI